MLSLARCKNLEWLEIGLSQEKMEKLPAELTPSVKQFILKKQSKLKTLRVYECDGPLLQLISQGPES
jgi:hypothetical protein